MLIKSKNFSVLPVTTHIDLSKVAKKISTSLIIKKILTLNVWFKSNYKKKPKIGILGLNPHNAELKKNSEESKVIIPAIKRLKEKGIKVHGPLVSDTVFINKYKDYDVIVGMYHDQACTFQNYTLGLKYPLDMVWLGLIKKGC